MIGVAIACASFAASATSALAAAQPSYTPQAVADEIASLPGAGGPLTSRHFSGFLDGGGDGDRLHYWLVESEQDPGRDPLALWLNGGPGASSLMGSFTEFGPYVISADGGIHYNPYHWAKKANVVWLEAPAGVGFSYCGGNVTKTCHMDDDSMAAGGLQALRSLLDRFPALQGRDFMVWGESYAGVYVPALSQAIARADPPLPVAFLGFSVGNPCTNDRLQQDSGFLGLSPEYAYNMGLIDLQLWNELKQDACEDSFTPPGISGRTNCPAAWRKFDLLTSGLDPKAPHAQMPGLGGGAGFIDAYDTGAYIGSMTPYWDAVGTYLNRPEVRRAIHTEGLPAWSLFASRLVYETQYRACGVLVDNDAPQYNKSMLPIYRELTNAGYSVMLYSGDQDPGVQWPGSEASMRSVGHPEAANRGWRPWFYQETAASIDLLAVKAPEWAPSLSAAARRADDAVLGGYIVEFEAPGTLTFATIRGVGHMVPQFRPIASLHLFDRTMSAAVARRGAPPRLAPPLPEALAGASDAEWYGSSTRVGAVGRWLSEAQAMGLNGAARTAAPQSFATLGAGQPSSLPTAAFAAIAGAVIGAAAMWAADGGRRGQTAPLDERLL